MGNYVDRGNQYIQLVKVLCCKLPIIGKQLLTFLNKDQVLNKQPETSLFSSYIYLTFKTVNMLETGDTSLQSHCPKVTAPDIWRFVGSLCLSAF